MIYVLSLIGLLSIAIFSTEFASRIKEEDQHALRRRLEAPHPDKIPGKFLVKVLVKLSQNIYGVSEDDISTGTIFTKITFQEGLKFKYWVDNPDGLEALIVKSTSGWDERDRTIIVFRGSEETTDWISNISFGRQQARFPNAPSTVEVHGGWQDMLFETQNVRVVNEALETSVVPNTNAISLLEQEALRSMGNTNELYFTGDSLGCALTQIMTAYLADKYPNIKVTNIGFGCPKVGNMAFKNWSEQKSNLAIWRYVYNDDAVPRLPPRTLLFQPLGFEHAGHTIQINPGNNCIIYYRHVGNGGAYSGVPSDWERFWPPHSIDDHKIANNVKHFDDNYNNAQYWPNRFLGGTPYPTAAPSPSSFVCRASEFQGSTISFEAFNACWKMDLTENGVLIGDFVYPECSRNNLSNGQVYSLFDSYDDVTNRIHFNDSNNWSGYFTIYRSSEVTDIEVSVSSVNPGTKQFALDLVSPNCS
jgi:hypothetical protein